MPLAGHGPRPDDGRAGTVARSVVALRRRARAELERPAPRRVLEVGPGRGTIAARLVAAGHDYTGVERSPASRRSTSALLATIPGRGRVVESFEDVAWTEQFDLLCAFEVLEHIEDDAGALREWAAWLRPGGNVLLSVPAWPDRFSCTDAEVGHLRRYTPEGIAALAEQAGLADVQVRLYGFPLGYLLERAREVLARRAERGRRATAGPSTVERTERSGAWYQPPRWSNGVVRWGTAPFRWMQRRVDDRGTGLVLSARAPSP